jgi:GYF domain 2
MGMKWYYAENGERAGPATREEIVKLIERDDAPPILIWPEGLEPDSKLYKAGLSSNFARRLSITDIIASLAKPSAMTAIAS